MKRRKFLASAAATAGLSALAGRVGAGDSCLAGPSRFGPVPAWVSSLPLWQWYEIPGTALSRIDPTPKPLGISGPSAKINAWCGAALRRNGSVYLIGAAGGHADYAGNEVSALALNVATPGWKQLRAPSANADIIDRTQFYLDRRPSATHTYYASQFIDELDRLMVFASPGVSGPFPAAPIDFAYTGDKRSASFNLATGDWDDPDYVAPFPASGDFTACLCVKHPRTGDVYYSRNYGDGWYRWTRVNNSWTKLSSSTRAPWYSGAAIDPLRDRMLIVGGYSPVAAEVRDLNGIGMKVSFGGLGPVSLTRSGYPGVIYDEACDRYIVLYNFAGMIQVLHVDASNWRVEEPTMAGPAPAARTNGIQNSVQYVPELRGFVIANRHSGNVLFVRTTV
jgi:hypothetical protein